jgi:hypothetical protein
VIKACNEKNLIFCLAQRSEIKFYSGIDTQWSDRRFRESWGKPILPVAAVRSSPENRGLEDDSSDRLCQIEA